MSSEIEKRIQVLEEKHDYQDYLVEQLNQVIIDQQKQIDNILDELNQLKEEVTAAGSDLEDVNEPPPHY